MLHPFRAKKWTKINKLNKVQLFCVAPFPFDAPLTWIIISKILMFKEENNEQ